MKTLIDLTRPLTADSLSYPGNRPGMGIASVEAGSSGCRVSELTRLDLHLGTHIDAPLHFFPEATDVAGLGLRLLPIARVECTTREIGPEQIPQDIEGDAVLFDTGWLTDLRSPAYFDGFPVLTREAARLLVNRGAALVGLDTPSADLVDDHAFPIHRILLGAGIPIVEGLVNLPALREHSGHLLFAAFPLPIEGAEGCPVRAVAFVSSP